MVAFASATVPPPRVLGFRFFGDDVGDGGPLSLGIGFESITVLMGRYKRLRSRPSGQVPY